MDPSRWKAVEELFHRASELPAEAVEAFLKESTDDSGLRHEVRTLLESADEDQTIVQVAVERAAQVVAEGSETEAKPLRLGGQIGPYRLVEVLGSGGMGTVYLAQRDDLGFEQRVAIKVTRAEIHGSDITTRFLVERQILASLNHPNIARLLDGGTTDSGLPYVVMEYLEGQPLDQYCLTQRPSIKRRVEIIQEICRAVQYAHEKLVIHRDLKPGNILVTPAGVPKLLDFGIAKLLDPDPAGVVGAETVWGQRPLTPEYASPEQLRGDSMNTASDVYSIGVLLYEILTGRRPYDATTRDPAKIEKALRDDEILAPSERVQNTHRDAAQAFPQLDPISGFREPKEKRAALLAGELDTIALKALRFDPERRYPTAAALALDLRNYLEDRPISARPDTWRYRTVKFIRRNRLSVGIATLGILLLALSAVTASVMAVRLRQQRDVVVKEVERKEEMLDFLTSLFEDSKPSLSAGRDLTASQLLERAAERLPDLSGDPSVRSSLARQIASAHLERGEFAQAEKLSSEAISLAEVAGLDYEAASAMAQRAIVRDQIGQVDEAVDDINRALEIFRAAPDGHADETAALTTLGTLFHAQQRYEEAREVHHQVLDREKASGENSHYTYNNLAQTEQEAGNYELAIELQEKSLALGDEVLERPHFLTAIRLNNLASALSDVGRMDEALQKYQEALAMHRELYPGGGHPDLGTTLSNIGVLYSELEEWELALTHFEQAREILTAAFGPDHPDLAQVYSNINLPHRRLGRSKDSEAALLEAIRINDLNGGAESLSGAVYRNNLGMYYDSVNNLPKAKAQLTRALNILRSAFGDDHPYVGSSLSNLAGNERSQGNFEAAEALSREALTVSQANGSPASTTASLRYGLAQALFNLDRLEEAEGAYRASYEEFKSFQEPTHGQRQLATLGLAETLLVLERDSEALPLLEECEEANESKPLPEDRHDRLLLAHALLASRSSDLLKARAFYEEAFEGDEPTSALLESVQTALIEAP